MRRVALPSVGDNCLFVADCAEGLATDVMLCELKLDISPWLNMCWICQLMTAGIRS